jgi:hypothetical protein
MGRTWDRSTHCCLVKHGSDSGAALPSKLRGALALPCAPPSPRSPGARHSRLACRSWAASAMQRFFGSTPSAARGWPAATKGRRHCGRARRSQKRGAGRPLRGWSRWWCLGEYSRREAWAHAADERAGRKWVEAKGEGMQVRGPSCAWRGWRRGRRRHRCELRRGELVAAKPR